MPRFLVVFAALAGVLCVNSPILADNPKSASSWPQLRGPDGQGHVACDVPTTWNDTSNKMWDVPIPGKAWSSPVVGDGKVWMTTAVAAPKGKGGPISFRVIAVEEQSGKRLHDIELFTATKPVKLHDRNSLATPTPVLGNGRLYVSFGSDGVACVDTMNQKIVWKNDTLKVEYETGPASSPVLYKDLLILPCDGSDVQFVVALKADTGEIAWKTDRSGTLPKDKSSRRAFATPLVITVDGRDQIIMPGSHSIYSYHPANGKELWRVATSGFSNVPRPVFAQGLVITTTGFAPPDLIAIRPDGSGDVSKSHVAWRHRKNVPNVPSPIVVGNNLYMVADKGLATCLDVATGKEKWTERLNGSFSASPLARGNTIYAFADNGTTILFEAADTYKEIGRNELTGFIQATPAAAADSLFIRTDKTLVRIGKGS